MAGMLALEAQWELQICVSGPTIISMCLVNDSREGRLSSCLVCLVLYYILIQTSPPPPLPQPTPVRYLLGFH